MPTIRATASSSGPAFTIVERPLVVAADLFDERYGGGGPAAALHLGVGGPGLRAVADVVLVVDAGATGQHHPDQLADEDRVRAPVVHPARPELGVLGGADQVLLGAVELGGR